jgi:hypothetical protein
MLPLAGKSNAIGAETTMFRCAASFVKHAGSFSAGLPAPGVLLASSSRYPDDQILGGNQDHV